MTTVRCSELDRVLACNGSLTLTRIVTPRKGKEGDEGTWLHYAAHAQMKDVLRAAGELGPTPPMPASSAVAQWIADYYFRTVQETVPTDWSLECEVAMAYDYGSFVLSGHIDCLAVNTDGTQAIGFDLKTGYDPVDPAEENWQMLGYVVLLLRAYPQLRNVTFYIVQPRNDEDEGYQRVSKVELKDGSIEYAQATLVGEIEAALRNSMEVDSGMKQCKWCAAAMQCPAAIAEREIMKAKLTPELLASIKETPNDAALIHWVRAAKTLSRPMDDAEAMLKERVKENGSAVGEDGTLVTLKTEGGSYEFPDPAAFYAATRQLIPDDAMYAGTVKPSTVRTKDAIAKARGIPKSSKRGESAESVFDRELGHLCVQGERQKFVWQTP